MLHFQKRPNTIGVEPTGANALYMSLKNGNKTVLDKVEILENQLASDFRLETIRGH
jgi:threonine dehydratase